MTGKVHLAISICFFCSQAQAGAKRREKGMPESERRRTLLSGNGV